MKVIFLDRDGVINRYPGDTKYVTSLKGFRFLPRAKKAIALLHKNKFKIFVISNQAGVGKGLFSQKSLNAITDRMLFGVRKANGEIKGVYYCTHRKEENCFCRKPKVGMMEQVLKQHGVNPKGAYFIGDTIRDVDTARAAGCKAILVLSGKEKLTNRHNWQTMPDLIFNDLYAATKFILKQR
jgi:histidinol-phosphate phosphatase family protein